MNTGRLFFKFFATSRELRTTVSRTIAMSTTPLQLTGYRYADWGSNADRKSITGYFFKLYGEIVCWMTRKQQTVTFPSTEAEYLATSETARQAIPLRQLLSQLGFPHEGPLTIYTDNRGAILLADRPTGHHSRTKHFDNRHHFIRKQVKKGVIQLEHCPTTSMIADMLTKALPHPQLEKLRSLAGISPITDA